MSEKFKLYKRIEAFIDNNCEFKKNEPFIINFLNEKENSAALPQVRDTSNFIQCIMNIPKEKEDLLKDAQSPKGLKINVIDSSFEFILYKSNTTPSVIKCLLLLIINDLEKVEAPEEETKNEKQILDINSEYKLLEKLKKFIFDYIKINKKNKKSSQNEGTNNVLENILLGGATNGIRFFNQDNNRINIENENIKKIIEIIKSISSKLEIKQKKNEKEKKENKKNEEVGEAKESKKKAKKESDKVINDVLDELNPDYKNELIIRYLDEMPEEIVNLMKKYKNISFTKNMYMEFLEKNKGITNGEETENKNDEERMDEELF